MIEYIWIWFALGLVPHFIMYYNENGCCCFVIQTAFWRFNYLHCNTSTVKWSLDVPLINWLRNAVWTIAHSPYPQ
jgi:hypothetical protein